MLADSNDSEKDLRVTSYLCKCFRETGRFFSPRNLWLFQGRLVPRAYMADLSIGRKHKYSSQIFTSEAFSISAPLFCLLSQEGKVLSKRWSSGKMATSSSRFISYQLSESSGREVLFLWAPVAVLDLHLIGPAWVMHLWHGWYDTYIHPKSDCSLIKEKTHNSSWANQFFPKYLNHSVETQNKGRKWLGMIHLR